MSPLNSFDPPFSERVKAGDDVLISVVFTWDKPLAESMGNYYRSIGAKVQIGGPAYDDPGGEFCPGRFNAPGVVISHRGCVRNCKWCYVPKREGQKIRHLATIHPGNILQDNNILACNREHKEKVWSMLRKQRAVSLRGGLDARLLKDEDIENIRSLRLYDLFTAYDDKENKKASLSAIQRLRSAGIPQGKLRCYVLIGFDGETRSQAEGRLWDCFTAGALPFAQLYDKFEGTEEETKRWKRLARIWSRPPATKGRYKEMCEEIMGDL